MTVASNKLQQRSCIAIQPVIAQLGARERHNSGSTSQLDDEEPVEHLHHIGRRGGGGRLGGGRRRSGGGEDGRRSTGVDVDALQRQSVVAVTRRADDVVTTPQRLPTHVSRSHYTAHPPWESVIICHNQIFTSLLDQAIITKMTAYVTT